MRRRRNRTGIYGSRPQGNGPISYHSEIRGIQFYQEHFGRSLYGKHLCWKCPENLTRFAEYEIIYTQGDLCMHLENSIRDISICHLIFSSFI